MMRFKTPGFWYRRSGEFFSPLEILFWPFTLLYRLARWFHFTFSRPYLAGVPVLCVGNVVAGGSGKTPTALALHRLIISSGLATAPVFLTRGYGGSEDGPVVVNVHSHNFAAVGDEALMLAARGGTIVSSDRAKGAGVALQKGADFILMDDGFQNPDLRKDLSFLVIDGETGFGNGKLLPAGPLRESVPSAYKRASAIVIIGQDKTGVLKTAPKDMAIFRASLQPCGTVQNKTYIGFAGLGRPEKFKITLENAGVKLAGFYSFPDHYAYTASDLEKLVREADRHSSPLITTEKDFMRIPENFRSKIEYLPVELVWEDEHSLVRFLKEKLGADS